MEQQVSMVKRIAAVLISLAMASALTRAQSAPPPVVGLTGSIGMDGTIDKFYKNTHRAIVKTADGVRHLVHVTKQTAVHGGESSAGDPFIDLKEGNQVVVHYIFKGDTKTALEIDRIGDGGLAVIDGTVTAVDRVGRTLTIRLADDREVTLRLTERAARDVGKDVRDKSRVVVYYTDQDGDELAHYFRTVR
jgi:hypothetical protein